MTAFDDLLTANERYAQGFRPSVPTGTGRTGVAILTCMDVRVDPLPMLGLTVGDANVLRTPGGFLTPDAVAGLVFAVHLLGVERILVVEHTDCAMAAGTDDDARRSIRAATGTDVGDFAFGADPDQAAHLARDVVAIAEHPLIAGRAEVAGFLLETTTGRLLPAAR